MNKHRVRGGGTNRVAIAPFQSRTSDHPAVVCGEPASHELEPGESVRVVERVPSGHLGDVLRRVKVIAILERHAKFEREKFTDGGLTAARYAHHYYPGGAAHRSAPYQLWTVPSASRL